MISALLILILTTLLCLGLGFLPGYARLARIPALAGTGMALLVSLALEGLPGAGVVEGPVSLPQSLAWLGASFYRSDALSAGLGAWCLLLGGVCLLRAGWEEIASWGLAVSVAMIATLYSLVHVWDLRVLAAHLLLLALLAAVSGFAGRVDTDVQVTSRHGLSLGLGAVSLLGAALLVGRTTGGTYSMADLSLSALTQWPLVLMALFILLWLGLVPLTGWSAQGHRTHNNAIVQALVIGIPALTLMLRLQETVTIQGSPGQVPPEWGAFVTTLAWLGGITAPVAAAGMLVWAGTARWSALLTAYSMGLVMWAVALDNPAGRYAALAIFLAFSAGRVALENFSGAEHSWANAARAVAGFSLGMAPLTPGFLGVWLLGMALAATQHPSLALVLLGAVAMSAYSVALELATRRGRADARLPRTAMELAGAGVALLFLIAGVLPGLWLPGAAAISGVAGGVTPVNVTIWGPVSDASVIAPLAPVGSAALVLLGICGLVTAWARSGAGPAGMLLPTALDRLNMSQARAGEPVARLLAKPPMAIWWLSLAWLEAGLSGLGTLLARLGVGAGGLLGRLEGRFYLPLALILTLIALLAVTR